MTTERAAQAAETAAAAGRELGLEVTEPTVLYDVFSAVVHLKPSPVVARIPLVLPGSLLEPEHAGARQQRELEVAQWIYEQGELVVRPSPLVPRRSVQRDGFSVSFWEYVEHDKSTEPDYTQGVVRSAAMHALLAEYPAELPWFAPVTHAVPEALEQLSADTPVLTAADVDRARSEWELLEPLCSTREAWEAAFPGSQVQAIHGDAPYYNIIPTAQGVLWSDFEDANLGPIEWDLAGVPAEYVEVYNKAAAELGRPVLDERAQVAANLARALQLLAVLPLTPQMPGMADALEPLVGHWRAMPFAYGLE
ncbi:phosphotransferase [Kribbella sp. NPDC051770]|uniref:phosphotransferase n=1 Tax=Kribbella sp. NPDC051770 TaxID=3155413 RepID=UPI003429C769